MTEVTTQAFNQVNPLKVLTGFTAYILIALKLKALKGQDA